MGTSLGLPFFPQGDRGFDGLPGLPGEKGHRVSILGVGCCDEGVHLLQRAEK